VRGLEYPALNDERLAGEANRRFMSSSVSSAVARVSPFVESNGRSDKHAPLRPSNRQRSSDYRVTPEEGVSSGSWAIAWSHSIVTTGAVTGNIWPPSTSRRLVLSSLALSASP